MVWDESKHPRAKDGKFTDGTGQSREARLEKLKRIYNSEFHPQKEVDSILLPDEQIPRSVGAKWSNYEITMPNGETVHFLEGSKLQNKEVFAGKGCKRKIDCVERLCKQYGGKPENWQKVKAKGIVVFTNKKTLVCEVHWYEESSCGKVEFKYKGELE